MFPILQVASLALPVAPLVLLLGVFLKRGTLSNRKPGVWVLTRLRSQICSILAWAQRSSRAACRRARAPRRLCTRSAWHRSTDTDHPGPGRRLLDWSHCGGTLWTPPATSLRADARCVTHRGGSDDARGGYRVLGERRCIRFAVGCRGSIDLWTRSRYLIPVDEILALAVLGVWWIACCYCSFDGFTFLVVIATYTGLPCPAGSLPG